MEQASSCPPADPKVEPEADVTTPAENAPTPAPPADPDCFLPYQYPGDGAPWRARR